ITGDVEPERTETRARTRMPEPRIEIVARVASIRHGLGIPHVIGGSLPSAAHDTPRTTADADLVIDLRADQIDNLAGGLGADFYVSRDAMRDAVRDRDSFNAISLVAPFKIDFYVLGRNPFDAEEFRRRVPQEMGDDRPYSLMVKTAEDTILRKLEWFRKGGEVSDQQWHDVLGVLTVSGHRLNNAYLDRRHPELAVADLLAEERAQSVA